MAKFNGDIAISNIVIDTSKETLTYQTRELEVTFGFDRETTILGQWTNPDFSIRIYSPYGELISTMYESLNWYTNNKYLEYKYNGRFAIGKIKCSLNTIDDIGYIKILAKRKTSSKEEITYMFLFDKITLCTSIYFQNNNGKQEYTKILSPINNTIITRKETFDDFDFSKLDIRGDVSIPDFNFFNTKIKIQNIPVLKYYGQEVSHEEITISLGIDMQNIGTAHQKGNISWTSLGSLNKNIQTWIDCGLDDFNPKQYPYVVLSFCYKENICQNIWLDDIGIYYISKIGQYFFDASNFEIRCRLPKYNSKTEEFSLYTKLIGYIIKDTPNFELKVNSASFYYYGYDRDVGDYDWISVELDIDEQSFLMLELSYNESKLLIPDETEPKIILLDIPVDIIDTNDSLSSVPISTPLLLSNEQVIQKETELFLPKDCYTFSIKDSAGNETSIDLEEENILNPSESICLNIIKAYDPISGTVLGDSNEKVKLNINPSYSTKERRNAWTELISLDSVNDSMVEISYKTLSELNQEGSLSNTKYSYLDFHIEGGRYGDEAPSYTNITIDNLQLGRIVEPVIEEVFISNDNLVYKLSEYGGDKNGYGTSDYFLNQTHSSLFRQKKPFKLGIQFEGISEDNSSDFTIILPQEDEEFDKKFLQENTLISIGLDKLDKKLKEGETYRLTFIYYTGDEKKENFQELISSNTIEFTAPYTIRPTVSHRKNGIIINGVPGQRLLENEFIEINCLDLEKEIVLNFYDKNNFDEPKTSGYIYYSAADQKIHLYGFVID